ncbi:DUF2897 family protein [Shewanella maritima]|uniref:DUF2897 family protein n=1 Tax=Shewanella maritima TaxID=2520507 RepID=UPI003735758B
MQLEGLEVWLIIILVVGVIASNLAVLKYSAKFKMPQFGDPKKPEAKQEDSSTSDTETSAQDKSQQTKQPEDSGKP